MGAKLSVNVNKIATLRNARGKNLPDLHRFAQTVIELGAHGITVHPRPDERHVKRQDVTMLALLLKEYTMIGRSDLEFNIEGYPSADFIQMVCAIKPTQCTLVPDPPHVLTSNAGFCVSKQIDLLRESIIGLKATQVRVSVFMDPFQYQPNDLEILKSIGCDCIELYTEAFADAYGHANLPVVLEKYQLMAKHAQSVGLKVNAGHDLNLNNLACFVRNVPQVVEVSIGHALISDALYLGIHTTMERYLACLCESV